MSRPPLIDRPRPQRSCWTAALIDCSILAAAAALGILLGCAELLIERIGS
ncbi:MAG: hypothetical protein V4696_12720 [Pseudomonadota bacterium]